MKDYGKVYLKAASHIGTQGANRTDSNYSCNAIAHIEGTVTVGRIFLYNGDANRLYRKVMQLHGFAIERVNKAGHGSVYSERGRNFRRFLLCMMAACWRDMLPLMEGK